MFEHRELGLVQAYQSGASLIMSILFWGYYALDPHIAHGLFGSYFEYYLIVILGFQVSFLLSRREDVFSIGSGIFESHRFIWPHLFFVMTITCIALVLTWDATVSRFFLLSYFVLIYFVLLIFSRYFALSIFRFFMRHETQHLLLVGRPEEVQSVGSLLAKVRLFGFIIVGLVTESPQEDLPPDIRKLGGPENLEEVLINHKPGNIFILGSPPNRRVLGGWIGMAEKYGCRVSLVNDLDVFLQRRLSYFRCDSVDLVEMHPEPLQNLVNRLIKRVFDILVSLPVVCLLLPPMMLLVWLLQRFQAPGPLLFRQNRSGMDNHPFPILKFRTMYADRCDSGAQATANDQRIYPVGRWMRRFSLDEFPQFFNVLVGDMSLVGPRPHMPQHDQVFAQRMASYRIRGFVKPGITGLAQVRGYRGEMVHEEDIIRRVEYDIEYIETWSFGLDIYIIGWTILQLVKPPKTAY